MRQKVLAAYSLGIAAIALTSLLVPAIAWPLPPGAFAYLLVGGPYSLLALLWLRHVGERRALAGMAYQRLAAVLALAAAAAYAAGLLGDIRWLAYGGAFFLFLSGEIAIRDRYAAQPQFHLPVAG